MSANDGRAATRRLVSRGPEYAAARIDAARQPLRGCPTHRAHFNAARRGRAGSRLVGALGALGAQLIERGLQLPEDVFKKSDVFLGAAFQHVEFRGAGCFVISLEFDQLRAVELEVGQIGQRGVSVFLSHDVLQC